MADFLGGRPSAGPGAVRPTYPLGVRFGSLDGCLPDFAAAALRRAVPIFDGKLKGFALPDAVLTGVETRSSSPVRVVRGEDFQSNLRGVYPCGEGAVTRGASYPRRWTGCARRVILRREFMEITVGAYRASDLPEMIAI
jgi:uncharacterized FAD-dependent dehydrogenase